MRESYQNLNYVHGCNLIIRRKSWRKCLKRAKTARSASLPTSIRRVTRTNLHFPSWRPATPRISGWKGFQERVRCVLRVTRLGDKAALMEVSCQSWLILCFQRATDIFKVTRRPIKRTLHSCRNSFFHAMGFDLQTLIPFFRFLFLFSRSLFFSFPQRLVK